MSRSRNVIRRGQSLVEFAVVALVMYLLLAAMLTFGHLLYVAQGLQTAADLAAREISRTPFHAIDRNTNEPLTFESLVDDIRIGTPEDPTDNDRLRIAIYDPAYLVIDLAAFYAINPNGDVFADIVPRLPLLNQQLAQVMIVDRPDTNGDGSADAWLLRYPGALLTRASAIAPPAGKSYESYVATNYAIGIPLVLNSTGGETIRWIPVVEEIDTEASPDNDDGVNPDPFTVVSAQQGIVALRINYPFQSASMSSFRESPVGPFEPNVGLPNVANDSAVTELNPPERPGELLPQSLVGRDLFADTYGGTYGLGAQGAVGSQTLTGGLPVRPFRRVISAQAIYRRELFR